MLGAYNRAVRIRPASSADGKASERISSGR
jgi:hypothetical protein